MTLLIEETDDLAACLHIRKVVFIDEQGVSEADERDDQDDYAIHLLARRDGQPIGTARILFDGSTGKIGRVCVLASERGTGLGKALIQTALTRLQEIDGITQAKLGAQTQALAFYERLGFVAQGPIYNDAGIPHRDMVRSL